MNGPIKCTPFLEQLTQRAQYFENAYCNNPLCVPSRMSFLSGKSSSQLGIYDNDVMLPSEVETLAGKLSRQGYRTVLVGRMHFKGDDQKHGFEERYVGDITTQWWGQKRHDLGAFQGTLRVDGCLNTYGYGNSPVQEYDEAVCEAACELLQEKCDRPLFLVVGLYGPHFPYCVKKEYFNHYYTQDLRIEDHALPCWEEYVSMRMESEHAVLQHVRSAYYGLVEKMDAMVSRLHAAARKNFADGVFIYTSDHGDQMGKRALFGKKTCYEESIKIPLIIEDPRRAAATHANEVSLLNLHAYLCTLAQLPATGPALDNTEPICIQSMIVNEGERHIEQAVLWQRFKYVAYDGHTRLISLKEDPNEEHDVKMRYPQIVRKLEGCLCDTEEGMRRYEQRIAEMEKRKAEFEQHPQEDWIRYPLSEAAGAAPQRRSYEEV